MIYATHGIVKNHSPTNHCHRIFLDGNKFEKYIRNKKDKYVTLEEALKGKGDALTIDDSTYAALEAAKLLRKHGHQVTIYINPYYIEKNIFYWFVILNYLLDSYSYTSICLQKTRYPCVSYAEKVFFRKKLKEIISILPTEEKRHSYLSKVFNIDLKNIDIPCYLKTLTKSDILGLQKLGVTIENHGWTHKKLDGLTPVEINNEIIKSKDWLINEFNIKPSYYAVPFGNNPPPDGYNFSEIKCWFLLQHNSVPGFITKKVYNRCSLKL